MIKYALLAFLALCLGGFFYVFHSFHEHGLVDVGKPVNAPTPVFAASAAVARGVAGPEKSKAAWSVRREEFRGVVGDFLLRTDVGDYAVGEMSPAGLVLGLRGRCAKCQGPEGLVYVVAQEPHAVAVAHVTEQPDDVPPVWRKATVGSQSASWSPSDRMRVANEYAAQADAAAAHISK